MEILHSTWIIALGLICLSTSIPLPPEGSKATCGYQSCPVTDPTKLNVHLVCHTHDDVGWLKTVDQYYYGSHNDIQRAGVEYTIDSVIKELLERPDRKFVYVESSFFWRWWNDQTALVKNQTQILVDNGQLEFIGGGWCMDDEATTHYRDIIDQMAWGLRFLSRALGQCAKPRVAWQIDPFGHSKEHAALLAQLGADAVFFARIDYEDRTKRRNEKTLELVWDASKNLGVEGEIFTGIFQNHYGPPSGFCFDDLCNDEPIKDNPILKGYNVDRRVDEFIAVADSQAEDFATNHIMMTMGNDFSYQNANTWYKNLDKLITYVNARQNQGGHVNVFYSTPSCYLQELNRANKTWTVKTDDFFPYGSDPHAYWTGYFTSRPSLKNYVRYGSNFLQGCKQLDSLAKLDPSQQGNIADLKRAHGDLQHHDGVSGTSKQRVAYDYAETLSMGITSCANVINDALQVIAPIESGSVLPSQHFCHLLNVSVCQYSETGESFAVTAYNPLSSTQRWLLKLPIASGVSYSVEGPDGEAINSEVVTISAPVVTTPEHTGPANTELVFAADLPPLGYKTFFVNANPVKLKYKNKVRKAKTVVPKADFSIQNEHLRVIFDGVTGLVKSVTDLATLTSYNIRQSFYYYHGMNGDNSQADERASGAYIFRPNGTTPYEVSPTTNISLVLGSEFQEVRQTFSDWVSQTVRLTSGQKDITFEWLVGPIPVGDLGNRIGKEVITRFETDLASDGYFYTDSNGRENLERRRDYRPTWTTTITEPVASNYYPINSFISIKDSVKDQHVTVVVDRAVGGSSMTDGHIEIMLHRRLLHDDSFGVGEALNEPGFDGNGLVVTGQFQLLVSSVAQAPKGYREASRRITSRPILSFASLIGTTPAEWRQDLRTQFSGLNSVLPENVNLLSLEQWDGPRVLLRLENFWEVTDDPSSGNVTVNVQNLFSSLTVVSAEETALGGDRPVEDLANRFTWQTTKRRTLEKMPSRAVDLTAISLEPMQIRTFILTVA